MSVGEDGAAGGEPIHVRGPDLRMAAEKSHPVVQVIDGDEEDVRWAGTFAGCSRRVAGECKQSDGQKKGVSLISAHVFTDRSVVPGPFGTRARAGRSR